MSTPQNAGTSVLGKRKIEACPCAAQAGQKRAQTEGPLTLVGAIQGALGLSGAGFPDDVIKLVAECTFWRVECSHCCTSGLANPRSTAIDGLFTDFHKLEVPLPATGGCSIAANASSDELSLEGKFFERATIADGEEYEETNRLAYVFDPPSHENVAIAAMFDRAAAAEEQRVFEEKTELRQPAFVCGACEVSKGVISCVGCNALFPLTCSVPACESCHKPLCPRCCDPGFQNCDQCMEVTLEEEDAESFES